MVNLPHRLPAPSPIAVLAQDLTSADIRDLKPTSIELLIDYLKMIRAEMDLPYESPTLHRYRIHGIPDGLIGLYKASAIRLRKRKSPTTDKHG